MKRNLERTVSASALLALAVLAACSVDTSEITFARDETFGQGGVSNVGAVSNGGALSGGGVLSKAGAGGKSNPSGGTGTAGGKQIAGGDSGGSPALGGSGGGGAGNVGGMPPEECPPGAADPSMPLVDDINDADPGIPMVAGRIGGWYLATDGTPGGMIMPMAGPNMPPMPAQPGAGGSPFAMRASGGGFNEWGISLGLALLSAVRDAPACPYDLTRQAGVRFMLRGAVSDMIVRFQLPTVQTHQPMQGGTCVGAGCGDHYGFDVPITASWQEVKVDFAELTQVGWGQEMELNLRDALNIEFHVAPSTTFDFWVDDITFY